MIENAQRTAPQVGTLEQYFRILKMIYKRGTGAMLDEDVVCNVNAVSITLILRLVHIKQRLTVYSISC